jgi:nucleotide-binding universal stress UspA family protein
VTPADSRPVIVAYDGSPEAEVAVREAVALFGGHPLVVLTVWEQGLATLAMAPSLGEAGMYYLPPDPAEVAAVDDAQKEHAVRVAEAGAQLARGLGASADPLPLAGELEIAETVAQVADERDACVIVVGSRGLGRVKRHLLGSTSQRLLRETQRPVLLVRAPE